MANNKSNATRFLLLLILVATVDVLIYYIPQNKTLELVADVPSDENTHTDQKLEEDENMKTRTASMYVKQRTKSEREHLTPQDSVETKNTAERQDATYKHTTIHQSVSTSTSLTAFFELSTNSIPLRNAAVNETSNKKYNSSKQTRSKTFINTTHNRGQTMPQILDLVGKDKETVRRLCSSNHSRPRYNTIMSLHYVSKFNLAAKLTAKVGTTFTLQMFNTLQSNETNFQSQNLSRSFIHSKQFSSKTAVPLKVDVLPNTTIMIFARNPFSRLYSAYIDKVYLLNSLTLIESIQQFLRRNSTYRKNVSCDTPLTFQDFIKYTVYSARKVLSGHYAPITPGLDRSVLCYAKDLAVIRQESFSSDIEHVLRLIDVDQEKVQAVRKLLYEDKAENSVIQIMKTTFGKYRMLMGRLDCILWSTLAKRLWTAFQIQGYISKSVPFPEKEIQNVDHKTKTFTNVVINTVKENTISKEEADQQRKEALAKAYATIEDSEIKSILKIYKADFDIFQYDLTVPD